MYMYAVFVLAAIVHQAYQQDTCSYTFQVPKENTQSTCASLDTLELRVAELEAICGTGSSGGGSGSGVNYIRYGNTECSAGSQLIYDGYMGSSFYSHAGGSNFLCLPKEDIEWPTGAKINAQSGSYIYGVEFQWQGSIDSLQGKHDFDILCAVCDASSKSQKLMIPARQTCPTGWTLEYSGLLMSSHSSHRDRDYICVDTTLEARPGSSGNIDGGLIYIVEAQCGALPCPPYEAAKEVACAVCTK